MNYWTALRIGKDITMIASRAVGIAAMATPMFKRRTTTDQSAAIRRSKPRKQKQQTSLQYTPREDTKMKEIIQVKRHDKKLPLPLQAYPGDAGRDLYLAEDVYIEPFKTVKAKTNIAMAIPEGYVGIIEERSSTEDVLVRTGIIDSGYRGIIRLRLMNLNPDSVLHIKRGERLAQIIVVPFLDYEQEEVDELPESVRGDKGFGSSTKRKK